MLTGLIDLLCTFFNHNEFKMKNPFTVLSLFLAMTVSLLGIVCAEESQTESKSPIQVALIAPSNGSQDAQAISAIGEKDPRVQITQLDGQQVRDGALDKFDLLILPGGSGSGQAKSLDKIGIQKGRRGASFDNIIRIFI